MPLAAVLENLDGVDERLHPEYEEGEDGKFYLKVEGAENLAAIKNLKSAFERLKEERRKFLADLKARDYEAIIKKLKPLPDDFDIDEYNETKDRLAEAERELEELKSGKTDPAKKDELARLREKLEQKNTALQKKLDDTIADYEKRLKDKQDAITRTIKESRLNEALDKVSVKKTLRKAASAMLRDEITVEEVDGEYKAVVKTDMGDVDLDKYVSDWAASDDGKEFVEKMKGSGAEGSDKGGKGEANPWDAKTRNLTAQGEIIKKDKAKARRLMEAAKIPEQRIKLALGEAA